MCGRGYYALRDTVSPRKPDSIRSAAAAAPIAYSIPSACRCHKILGTPMKMGTRGPHSPGKMGTPLGKWSNPVAVFQSKLRMENDPQLEQGRFTFNDIHRYLREGCYPDGYTKADKLALRKRAKFFCTRGADLIYVGG